MSIEIHNFSYSKTQIEKRLGFSDEELISKAKQVPFLKERIERVSHLGYCYIGDTIGHGNDTSKAYTDPVHKWILIGKEKTGDEALLSLTYEINNALNHDKLEFLTLLYMDTVPCKEVAEGYARGMLSIDAESAYFRSLMAIYLGKEELIKNPKYLEITKKFGIDQRAAVWGIFNEMLAHGTVHNGREKAFDFYVADYWDYQLD